MPFTRTPFSISPDATWLERNDEHLGCRASFEISDLVIARVSELYSMLYLGLHMQLIVRLQAL